MADGAGAGAAGAGGAGEVVPGTGVWAGTDVAPGLAGTVVTGELEGAGVAGWPLQPASMAGTSASATVAPPMAARADFMASLLSFPCRPLPCGAGDRADGRGQPQAHGHDHGREVAEGPDPDVGARDAGEDHQQPRADEEGRPGRDDLEEVIHQTHLVRYSVCMPTSAVCGSRVSSIA